MPMDIDWAPFHLHTAGRPRELLARNLGSLRLGKAPNKRAVVQPGTWRPRRKRPPCRRPAPKMAKALTNPVRTRNGLPPFADSEAHMSEPLASRITWNPQQCGGKPCVRGMRIRVSDVLELLAQGVSEPTILADFPDLQPEDIRACLHFAAVRTDLERLVA